MTARTVYDWLEETHADGVMRMDRIVRDAGVAGLAWVKEAYLAGAASTVSNAIVLNDEDYDAFAAALDAPPKPNAKLQELMRRKPTWEKPG